MIFPASCTSVEFCDIPATFHYRRVTLIGRTPHKALGYLSLVPEAFLSLIGSEPNMESTIYLFSANRLEISEKDVDSIRKRVRIPGLNHQLMNPCSQQLTYSHSSDPMAALTSFPYLKRLERIKYCHHRLIYADLSRNPGVRDGLRTWLVRPRYQTGVTTWHLGILSLKIGVAPNSWLPK